MQGAQDIIVSGDTLDAYLQEFPGKGLHYERFFIIIDATARLVILLLPAIIPDSRTTI